MSKVTTSAAKFGNYRSPGIKSSWFNDPWYYPASANFKSMIDGSFFSCFSVEFLEQLLKFLVNFTLLKYVKSQRSYGFLITKELIFGFQILDLNSRYCI